MIQYERCTEHGAGSKRGVWYSAAIFYVKDVAIVLVLSAITARWKLVKLWNSLVRQSFITQNDVKACATIATARKRQQQ